MDAKLAINRSGVRFRPSMSFAQFHILASRSVSICNLDCKYCFYLEKEAL